MRWTKSASVPSSRMKHPLPCSFPAHAYAMMFVGQIGFAIAYWLPV